MDLTFSGYRIGKIRNLNSLPAGVHVLQEETISDVLYVSVPLVYWHIPFDDQIDAIEKALEALLLLLPLVPKILSQ